MTKKKDARHVRGIVDDLLRRWEDGSVKKGNAVLDAWGEATKEEAKGHARPVSLKNGVLMVIVENSSWLYELTLEKKEIMKRFNEKYTGRKKARDIRYRIGTME